jgi:hypothetical protein
MSIKIVSVTFDVEAQEWAPEFAVPTLICDLLRVDSGDEVALTILDPQGGIPLDGTRITEDLMGPLRV